MAERVFVGNDAGSFKLRVSKPGNNARTASLNNLTLHENQRPMVPVATGTVTVASVSAADVYVGGFSTPPKVVLRTSQNRIAAFPALYCRLELGSGTLRIFNNHPSTQIFRYVVFSIF